MNPGEETVPPGEEAAIDIVVEASERLLDRSGKPFVRRGQHPKQHGCVRAEFVVERDLPETYRVGIFREPKTYSAWIRFSNGAQEDDRKGDAHGMAIKLMGVEGKKVLEGAEDETTHDFIMVDNPRFFLRDAIEYAVFSDALVKARAKKPSLVHSGLVFLPGPLRQLGTLVLLYFVPWRLDELRLLLTFMSKRIASPLSTRYWSTTPYRFGAGKAMKFSARPALAAGPPPSDGGAGYLREAMAAHLRSGDARFEFQVQLQEDADAQPVEDATALWDEDRFPFRTVARIVIPAQEFDTLERNTFGEHLSFTPWHALADHRPLGGINRTRKRVYAALSRLRHELNGIPMREPSP